MKTLNESETWERVYSYVEDCAEADTTDAEVDFYVDQLEREANADGFTLTGVREMFEVAIENKIEAEG